MSYVDKLLMKDEKILHATKPHWIVYQQAFIWLLAMLVLLVFGPSLHMNLTLFNHPLYKTAAFIALIFTLIYAVPAYLKINFTEVALTNRRLIVKTGFFDTNSVEILLPKIESVQISKTLSGKIFDFGSVIVNGVGGSKDMLLNMPHPEQLRNMIQQEAEKWIGMNIQK